MTYKNVTTCRNGNCNKKSLKAHVNHMNSIRLEKRPHTVDAECQKERKKKRGKGDNGQITQHGSADAFSTYKSSFDSLFTARLRALVWWM